MCPQISIFCASCGAVSEFSFVKLHFVKKEKVEVLHAVSTEFIGDASFWSWTFEFYFVESLC